MALIHQYQFHSMTCYLEEVQTTLLLWFWLLFERKKNCIRFVLENHFDIMTRLDLRCFDLFTNPPFVVFGSTTRTRLLVCVTIKFCTPSSSSFRVNKAGRRLGQSNINGRYTILTKRILKSCHRISLLRSREKSDVGGLVLAESDIITMK